jgi:hypothetical protein
VRPVRKADNLTTILCRCQEKKSGNLNFLETSGPPQACNGTALPGFLILFSFVYFLPLLTSLLQYLSVFYRCLVHQVLIVSSLSPYTLRSIFYSKYSHTPPFFFVCSSTLFLLCLISLLLALHLRSMFPPYFSVTVLFLQLSPRQYTYTRVE